MRPNKKDPSTLRVLAIHRYFWPDTPPYASLLRALAQHWVSLGYPVDVLTSQPSYKPELELARMPAHEIVEGIRLRRIAMRPDRAGKAQRLWNSLRFPGLVALRILFGPRRDVVMCSTAPPVVLGALTCLAARLRGASFVYHAMDLHPEIGRLSGEFRNPLLYSILLAVDTWTCRRATRVVVLSSDMTQALVDRSPELKPKIVEINNFEIPSFDDDPAPVADRFVSNGRLRIVFTGNLGRFQGLEKIVAAALCDDDTLDELEILIMGEGAAKAELERIVAAAPSPRRSRVTLLPHGSVPRARALMRSADLGLVSLVPGIISYAYPSKTASYLSEGLPLLVGVEPGSELARNVKRWGVGEIISAESVDSVKHALLRLLEERGAIVQMQARTRVTWKENFSAESKLAQWDALLAELAEERCRA